MARYSFRPNIDGDEFPVMQRECDGPAQAIERGRQVLVTLLEPLDVQSAFVAVFTGDAQDGGEPLGCWDWAKDAPDPVWREDD